MRAQFGERLDRQDGIALKDRWESVALARVQPVPPFHLLSLSMRMLPDGEDR